MKEEGPELAKPVSPQDSDLTDNWVGRTLQDKYEIVSLIGRGGMGSVYCAKHLQLQVLRALKILRIQACPDRDSYQQALERFLREARTISSLSHPNIVTFHDLGEGPDLTPYVVMDLLEGQTLAGLIASGESLEVDRILAIMIQVSRGLEHAHSRGILHRDIKPDNIMLVKDENGRETVKILDFGIAKLIGVEDGKQPRLTRTGEVIGSPYYISPERAQGVRIDERSDIFSLGCVLYELIKGQVPFAGENAVATIVQILTQDPPALTTRSGSRVSAELEKLVFRCLEKDPRVRYQNVSQLQHDLELVRSGGPVPAVPLLQKARKALTRVRSAARPLCLALAAFVLLSCVFFFWKRPVALLSLARANICQRAHNYREATAAASRAIELDPELACAYEVRANSYGCLGQWQQEADDCTKAINIDPRLADAYLSLATACNQLGRHRQAIDHAGRAIELGYANLALAYEIRGSSHIYLQEYAQAIQNCTTAIKLDPPGVNAYLDRAYAYYKLDDCEKAVADATRALELNPKLSRAYHYRALCAARLHNWQKAINEDTKAIEADPNFANGYCDRASSFFQMSLFQKGIDDCTKAISLDPHMVLAYCRRAEGYLVLLQFQKAIDDATVAIRLDPEQVGAYKCRSRAYTRLGMHEKAAEDASLIVELLKQQLSK